MSLAHATTFAFVTSCPDDCGTPLGPTARRSSDTAKAAGELAASETPWTPACTEPHAAGSLRVRMEALRSVAAKAIAVNNGHVPLDRHGPSHGSGAEIARSGSTQASAGACGPGVVGGPTRRERSPDVAVDRHDV